MWDVVAMTRWPNVIPKTPARPKNTINGASTKPGIIVNNVLIVAFVIT